MGIKSCTVRNLFNFFTDLTFRVTDDTEEIYLFLAQLTIKLKFMFKQI